MDMGNFGEKLRSGADNGATFLKPIKMIKLNHIHVYIVKYRNSVISLKNAYK